MWRWASILGIKILRQTNHLYYIALLQKCLCEKKTDQIDSGTWKKINLELRFLFFVYFNSTYLRWT